MRLIVSYSWLLFLLVGCTNVKYNTHTEVNVLPERFNELVLDNYLLTHYKSLDTEQIMVIYLKDDSIIGNFTEEGSRYRASMPVLDVIAQCSTRKCNRVIFVHNHVGQYFAKPSAPDIDTTELLKERLSGVNISLIAHIVVSDSDTFWIR